MEKFVISKGIPTLLSSARLSGQRVISLVAPLGYLTGTQYLIVPFVTFTRTGLVNLGCWSVLLANLLAWF